MSDAVRYVTYGIAAAILLTFVYVAIEQAVQDRRAAKRERARRGYLPDDAFQNFRDGDDLLDTLGEIRRLPEVHK